MKFILPESYSMIPVVVRYDLHTSVFAVYKVIAINAKWCHKVIIIASYIFVKLVL